MSRDTPGTLAILAIYVILAIAFQLFPMNPKAENLLAAGALDPAAVAAGDVWRLVAAAFVHIGFLHFAFNAYFLSIFGPLLERELGLERFVILYVLAGIGGNVAIALLYPPGSLAAGGSTSLFGFMGALLAILIRKGHSYRDFFDNPAGRQILSLIVINLAIGWAFPIISNTGHVGGLIAGFGVTFFFFRLSEGGSRLARRPLIESVAFGLLFVAAIALACRPVVRTWYQARAAWMATPEQAPRFDRALAARRADPVGLRILEAVRSYREGVQTGEDEEVVRLLAARPDDLAGRLWGLGLDVEPFEPFLEAIRSGKKDPARYLAPDPWQRRVD